MNTFDDSDVRYFDEVDIKYPDEVKGKQIFFCFVLKIKKINSDSFTPYMKENEPKSYKQTKKVKCDWTDKKEYLFQ